MDGTLSRLAVVITAKTDQFSKGIDGVSNKLNKFSQSMGQVGRKMALGLTLPIIGIGTAAFKMAGDFDQAFRKVNVMLGASADEADAYKKKIIAISNETGKSASDVADAFYQIVSAGYRGSDAIDILTIAMKGATGGAADAEQTTAALTKAMSIFQLQGVEGSTRAMDVFFGIVDTGLLTFEEMANAFPTAATMATTLGVSIEETGAALGTLSKVTGSTEQAATALNAIFTQLVKPSADLQALYEKWGVETGAEAIERFGGLQGVLQKVTEATQGNVNEMANLFPNVEAIRGILPLATTNAADFSAALETVTGASGRTGEAFAEMTEGPGFQWDQMMNTLKNSMLLLGDAISKTLGPWIEKLIGWVQRAVEWFGNLSEPTQKIIIAVGLIVAAIGPLLMILGPLISLLPILGAAFTVLLGPVGLIVLAIAGAIAIGILIWKNWDKIKEKAKQIWDAIVGFFKKVGEGIKWIFLNMTPVGLIIKHWDKIKAAASKIWGGIKGFFSKVGSAIKNKFKSNWEETRKAAGIIWGKIQENSEEFGGGIKGTILGAAKTMSDGFKGFLEKMGIDTEALGNRLRSIWDGIVNFFRGIPGKIRAAFSKVKDIILAPFRFAFSALEKAINWLIRQINKISVTIPSWVPLIGGKTLGFNIPEISLPTFHYGGIVPGSIGKPMPVMAVGGERFLGPGESVGNNFYISELVVREEADIHRIARELYRLQQQKQALMGI